MENPLINVDLENIKLMFTSQNYCSADYKCAQLSVSQKRTQYQIQCQTLGKRQ